MNTIVQINEDTGELEAHYSAMDSELSNVEIGGVSVSENGSVKVWQDLNAAEFYDSTVIPEISDDGENINLGKYTGIIRYEGVTLNGNEVLDADTIQYGSYVRRADPAYTGEEKQEAVSYLNEELKKIGSTPAVLCGLKKAIETLAAYDATDDITFGSLAGQKELQILLDTADAKASVEMLGELECHVPQIMSQSGISKPNLS